MKALLGNKQRKSIFYPWIRLAAAAIAATPLLLHAQDWRLGPEGKAGDARSYCLTDAATRRTAFCATPAGEFSARIANGVYNAARFQFTATPATPTALNAGARATVTFSPCPDGVNGTDTHHYVWLENEPVLITGGTCVSGAASGTLSFTPAKAHKNWSLTSATAGIQEAIAMLPPAGGIVDARHIGNARLQATLTFPRPVRLLLGKQVLSSTAVPIINISGAQAAGSAIEGQKDFSRITGSANGRMIQVDSASAVKISGVLLDTTSTGSSVRGIFLGNTGGDNKWNVIEDVRFHAPAVAPGQYAVELYATTPDAMYWNSIVRVQVSTVDKGIYCHGDPRVPGAVCNGNFFRDIVVAASNVGIEFDRADNNYVAGVFHTHSGGPAGTIGIRMDRASENKVDGFLSDAGGASVPYELSGNSGRNELSVALEGGKPVDLGKLNMVRRSTAARTEILWSDGSNLYSDGVNLATDRGITIGPVADTKRAFFRSAAADTDYGFTAAVRGDPMYRYIVNAAGRVSWGTGAGAMDTNLYRSGVNQLTTDGALRIGAGTAITRHLSNASKLDFGSAGANACSADLAIVVAGAAPGDTCAVGVPGASVNAGSSFWCWVPDPNTVKVRHCNASAAANDPSPGMFRVDVWQH